MNAEPVTERSLIRDVARRGSRRLAAVLATGALLLTSACAAGQVAQTANQKPTLDGTEFDVGDMQLRGVAIVAPSGNFYDAGSNAAVRVVIVNTGQRADRLTGVTSAAFTGWRAYNNSLAASANVGGTQSVPITAGDRASFGVPYTRSVLLLRGLRAKTFPGTTIRLTFTFARAGSVTVPVPVQLSRTAASSVIPEPAASDAGG